jgi:hypothetical protein
VDEAHAKRRRTSVVRDILQKTLDCCIIVGILAGIFIGYAGHFWTAISVLVLVTIIASYRFFDQEAALRPTGVSDELDQNLPADELYHFDDSPDSMDSSEH